MRHNSVISGLVSTIIPVFNRPEMLRTAVKSVLAQTYRPIEVIIADDGSTDDTRAVAVSLVGEYPAIIRYCHSTGPSGAGPGPTRELGRQIARGEYIQYLDSDDRLLPNKFADQVALLQLRQDCDIAYSISRQVDQAGTVLAEPFKWTGRDIPSLFPDLLVDRWWCTHTPLYRRSLTDRIGPWSDLRWSQDWEYDARAGALRARLINCHTLVSEHLHHPGIRQTSDAAWGTDPERLKNRFQLLTALWKSASSLGIPRDTRERQHFSRWCFRIARQCDAAKLHFEGKSLFELAVEVSDAGSVRSGLKIYNILAKTIGRTKAGRVCRFFEGFKSKPGTSTLPQSFSGNTTRD
jgi:glycosyltransferase involved in cell wall biosynthesis